MPWDYRPWGCGSGKKGSCNNGWIQFEICEDGKNDPDYFTKAYEEACEITAYLCRLFNIDPLGTADCNGVTVPTILCHYDSCKLGLGSNHSDIYDWFPKYGKSMETARADVAWLLAEEQDTEPPEKEQPMEQDEQEKQPTVPEEPVGYFRVRKTWKDKASQLGAFRVLQYARQCADKNPGYAVFNESGEQIYPLT
jgi:hypothetical protein